MGILLQRLNLGSSLQWEQSFWLLLFFQFRLVTSLTLLPGGRYLYFLQLQYLFSSVQSFLLFHYAICLIDKLKESKNLDVQFVSFFHHCATISPDFPKDELAQLLCLFSRVSSNDIGFHLDGGAGHMEAVCLGGK